MAANAASCPLCHFVIAFPFLLRTTPGSAHSVPLGVGLGEPCLGWARGRYIIGCCALQVPSCASAGRMPLGVLERDPSLGLLCNLVPSGVTGPCVSQVPQVSACAGEEESKAHLRLFSSFLCFWSLKKTVTAQTFPPPLHRGVIKVQRFWSGLSRNSLCLCRCKPECSELCSCPGECWTLQAPVWRERSVVLSGGCRNNSNHLAGLL